MKVICYGDSNTYGYDPRSYWGGRYDADCRWVDILAEQTGWEIYNNGINSCEIPCREITFPQLADFLIVILGTNNLLQGVDVDVVANRMEAFLNGLSLEKRNILLITPPPMQLGEWVPNQHLIEASIQLAKQYKELSDRIGVRFADAGAWNISLTFDGVHFTENGHRNFACGLYRYLNKGE